MIRGFGSWSKQNELKNTDTGIPAHLNKARSSSLVLAMSSIPVPFSHQHNLSYLC